MRHILLTEVLKAILSPTPTPRGLLTAARAVPAWRACYWHLVVVESHCPLYLPGNYFNGVTSHPAENGPVQKCGTGRKEAVWGREKAQRLGSRTDRHSHGEPQAASKLHKERGLRARPRSFCVPAPGSVGCSPQGGALSSSGTFKGRRNDHCELSVLPRTVAFLLGMRASIGF